MFDPLFFQSDIFRWLVLPILIFLARVVDVSIGTMRIVYISRGKKYLAPVLGFFEILVWLLAIGQIFQNLSNIACYLAYAAGFASGNFVGMYIEHKLAIGMQVVRIITRREAWGLIDNLKDEGYGITVVNGQGTTGEVKVIFTIIKRKDFEKIVSIVRKHNPKAFFSVEDIRMANEGIYPDQLPASQRLFGGLFSFVRKGK
jgi:uncharacterized protein YebE (UPF0316 family)